VRILYISQYFPPEVGATQNRAYEMARGLIQAGHEVTMVTEFPNHPTGIIPERYRGRIFEVAKIDGIEVIRTWVKASPSSSFSNRIAFYLSFALMSTLAGLLKARGPFDLVYATSPPLFVGCAGLVIAFLRRIPFVLEVRDLWPESAVTLGQLKNRVLIALATVLEKICYRQASHIVVTAQEMFDHFVDRRIPADKITVVRNGANTKLFRRSPDLRRRIRFDLELEEFFIIMYAGLHGLAQDLETLLKVAESLQEEHPEIRFLLIGDGPKKRQLQLAAEKKALSNVVFLPSQPRERIQEFINAADVTLAPLNPPHLRGAIPSKIFDSMACGVPVIVAAAGEARRVVEEAEAGVAVEPGDARALREAILHLSRHPELRARMGQRGREAAVKKYSRSKQAQILARLLEGLSGELH
jgi:glycosyltransferase involved in cell wall biosynthesis